VSEETDMTIKKGLFAIFNATTMSIFDLFQSSANVTKIDPATAKPIELLQNLKNLVKVNPRIAGTVILLSCIRESLFAALCGDAILSNKNQSGTE